jgi:hypothetical protein
MAKTILMDQFHVSISAPRGLPASTYRTIRHTLDDAGFHAALRRSIRSVCVRYPGLDRARVILSR